LFGILIYIISADSGWVGSADHMPQMAEAGFDVQMHDGKNNRFLIIKLKP
jgi:hypothetical protein